MNIDNYSHRPQNFEWSVGLCSACGDDGITCCITCFLPCITFGQIAEIVDEGKTSCVTQSIVYGLLFTISCHWFYSCMYREKMRKKFGLADEPCCDCCVHFCCPLCALCQEHAELKKRGFDPSQGWIGPPTVPPQMPPSMYR